MYQKDVCWGRIAYARPLRRKKTNWATICRAVCNTPLLSSMNIIKTGTAPLIYNNLYMKGAANIRVFCKKYQFFCKKSASVLYKKPQFSTRGVRCLSKACCLRCRCMRRRGSSRIAARCAWALRWHWPNQLPLLEPFSPWNFWHTWCHRQW